MNKVEKQFMNELIHQCQFMLVLLKSHVYRTGTVWRRLVEEGNHTWVGKLAIVERYGIGTVIVPKDGISSNPQTNKKVITWLHKNKVRTLCVEDEIQKLEQSASNLNRKEKIGIENV